jgi:hypothetical protein
MAEGTRVYEFNLVLSWADGPTTEFEDALYEAGCDDATLSYQGGRAYLSFAREARSFAEAVLGAIRDVDGSGTGADVVRVDAGAAGLVGQSDIARAVGRSRQLIHQYVKGVRGPGGFPAPVTPPNHEGGPLWRWPEVARWLREHDMIGEDAASEAEEAEAVNNALAARRLRRTNPKLAREVARSVGGR